MPETTFDTSSQEELSSVQSTERGGVGAFASNQTSPANSLPPAQFNSSSSNPNNALLPASQGVAMNPSAPMNILPLTPPLAANLADSSDFTPQTTNISGGIDSTSSSSSQLASGASSSIPNYNTTSTLPAEAHQQDIQTMLQSQSSSSSSSNGAKNQQLESITALSMLLHYKDKSMQTLGNNANQDADAKRALLRRAEFNPNIVDPSTLDASTIANSSSPYFQFAPYAPQQRDFGRLNAGKDPAASSSSSSGFSNAQSSSSSGVDDTMGSKLGKHVANTVSEAVKEIAHLYHSSGADKLPVLPSDGIKEKGRVDNWNRVYTAAATKTANLSLSKELGYIIEQFAYKYLDTSTFAGYTFGYQEINEQGRPDVVVRDKGNNIVAYIDITASKNVGHIYHSKSDKTWEKTDQYYIAEVLYPSLSSDNLAGFRDWCETFGQTGSVDVTAIAKEKAAKQAAEDSKARAAAEDFINTQLPIACKAVASSRNTQKDKTTALRGTELFKTLFSAFEALGEKLNTKKLHLQHRASIASVIARICVMAKQLPTTKQTIKAATFGKSVESIMSTFTRHADLTKLVLGAALSNNLDLLSSGDSVEEDEEEAKPLLGKRSPVRDDKNDDDEALPPVPKQQKI